ncbi:hypothetical protein VOLCADRAFT_85814 [Volvox carteri f. nagariensis]|uniref:Uncharacterized protein n=1 Tax=Volvox carteri f. nagariensis TaxID=3068 RepID=D8TH24_VOLCA|nr:uncharacterized protein VOLCADRAFT_85814 [Volvox carteri f. nagariensis]EFJ52634.1 hypothetical protein VOLCADRAFT_85814 [Volvox carteri f. nagariensis]|eukprot:XP_002945639.1 hypothetical protein VOLCADRAFT_85814 [Volvox carteri f. nagariensis]
MKCCKVPSHLWACRAAFVVNVECISWGQGTSKRGVTDWFSVFASWMISAFPRANITARNGCTPGVPTPYMIMCLELSVDPDVDLVFMEYTLNRRFYETTEDAQGALSQYYDVQYLSLRTALYRLAVFKSTPNFLWEDAYVDVHPGDHGHKIMADLAVHLIQRVTLGLLMEPYSSADAEAANEQLPEPMYLGNTAPSSPMCLVGAAFRRLVVSSSGFTYVNEGTAVKPKPGYVATEPGSRLQLAVNTDRSAVGSPAGEKVHVYVHHLRSYEHMGVAEVSCVSGCSCDPVEIDAHIKERVSQVYMSRLVVSQSRECVLEVKVTDKTSSGEHKFKVSGLVLAEKAGGSDIMERLGGDNQPFGLRQHNGDATQVVLTKAGRTGGDGQPEH